MILDESVFPSHRFTEQFVEELVRTINLIPSHQNGGFAEDRVQSTLQSNLIGGKRAAQTVIPGLLALRLISSIEGKVGRSASGDRVRREIRTSGSSALALAIIRSGLMADQLRSLRTSLKREGAGYACGRSAAVAAAPQLVGLLARLPGVVVGGRMIVDEVASKEIDSVWNELPPSGRRSWQDRERQRWAIGQRAELYSVQLESTAFVGARTSVRWVSRDDESLGYDIEVSGPPVRHVEVKGSSSPDLNFTLSANEHRTATRLRDAYEIHYWGQIDVKADPLEDFNRLRRRGFPVRICDPIGTLTAGLWTIKPSEYRVGYNGEMADLLG